MKKFVGCSGYLLCYGGCFIFLAAIFAAIKNAGIMLGGIPSALMFAGTFALATLLYKKWSLVVTAKYLKPEPEIDSLYFGDYKDGKMHGQGRLAYRNGDEYVGMFKNGKRNGRGVYTVKNGTIYDGEWKDDHMNGQGTLTSNDGLVYVGGFKDGKRNGHGQQTYPNGVIEIGEFVSNEYIGQNNHMNKGSLINNTPDMTANCKAIFCRKCGFKLPADGEYCYKCGKKIIIEEE